MSIKNFIYAELSGWNMVEKIVFPLEVVFITIISFYFKDNPIAILSSICGIFYTILAGKGKISCYIFGLCSTLCYAYLAYVNNFFGNVLLNLLFYFPMQIVGMLKWKKHLNLENRVIIKTELLKKERILYFIFTCLLAVVFSFVLARTGDLNPFADGITTVFSILGLILTVKRCIEQWFVWTIVNGISVFMWIRAFLGGSDCFALILMWGTYLVLGIYFWVVWNNELSMQKKKSF